jgi:glycosyltransferase domain-containing protein
MITLLIPTKNRSDAIIRLLRYYKEIGFEGCICIGDSSSPENVERTKRVIETFEGQFTLVYKEYPNLNTTECIKRLLDFVYSPYVSIISDDDFLIPNSINKCAKFLDEHPDYACAHGTWAIIRLDTNGLYGNRIVDCSSYYSPDVEAESASQRLFYYFRHYFTTIYSVHRTENFRVMWRDILKDNIFGSELLPSCLSYVLGKVKHLDCLHVVATTHGEQKNWLRGVNWVTNPEWYSSYLVFFDTLAKTLALQDKISIEEAQKVIKPEVDSMIRELCSCTDSLSPNVSLENRHSHWIQVGRKIPGAQRIWQFLHSFSGFSLSAMLRSSSPYHSDFMPVYKILTTPPPEFSDKTIDK